MKFLCGFTMALLLGWTPTLQAEDWARFRGASGRGLGKGSDIPTSLSEATALWKISLKGTGHSSPVVVGQKLFYTVTPKANPKQRDVVCVSTNDGKELWRKSFGFSEYNLHQFNSPSSTSPTADEERVYVWWHDGEKSQAFALDHQGESVWRQALGRFESAHGGGSSVVVADGVLIVQKENISAESSIFGLDAATGKKLWETPVPVKEIRKTPYVTPVIRDTDTGMEAIFASTDNGIFSLQVKTGAFRWKFDAKFEHRVVASPVVVGDLIFASCGGGGGGKDSVVIEAPAGASKVKALYRLSKQLPYVPTGLGIDGRLFLVNDGGVGTCYDVKSGDQLWRERLLGKCFASQIAIGDNIYAFGRDGDYKVFKAAANFELVAEGDLGAGIHATPAVGDGKLFVRTDERLLCFQKAPDA
ncbi:MAG: outer membrane protein assembly factor BamB [Verrucomicrobiales bacterium]|jgi:outer membrane protein assembly factor BamB